MGVRHLVAGIVVVVAVSLAAAGTAAPPSPWLGVWVGTDPIDDSNLRLIFGGGGKVTLLDDDATVACEPDSSAVAKGSGSASPDGSSFTGQFTSVKCAGSTSLAPIPLDFTYVDNGDGTITENVPNPTTFNRP